MFPKAVNGRDKIIRVNPNSCFKIQKVVLSECPLNKSCW